MKKQNSATKIAYPAILGALSLVFIYIASMVPSGNWGFVAIAGLFPAAAVISVSLPSGILCWVGASVLAFLLIPSKFCALLYSVLFGLYPIVKALIERLHKNMICYLLKLIFFNAAFTLIYVIMRAVVLDSLPSALHAVWLIYVVGNIVFLAYDFGFSRLISFYIARIGRAVK